MEGFQDAVITRAVLEGLIDVLFEILFLVVGGVGRNDQRTIRCGDLDQLLQQLGVILRDRESPLFGAGKARRIDDGHVILQFLANRVTDEIEDIHDTNFIIPIGQVVDGELFFGPFQRAGQSILVGSIASPMAAATEKAPV